MCLCDNFFPRQQKYPTIDHQLYTSTDYARWILIFLIVVWGKWSSIVVALFFVFRCDTFSCGKLCCGNGQFVPFCVILVCDSVLLRWGWSDDRRDPYVCSKWMVLVFPHGEVGVLTCRPEGWWWLHVHVVLFFIFYLTLTLSSLSVLQHVSYRIAHRR